MAIRARVVAAEGSWSLTIDGHASTEVCAAVTAVQQTVVIWLDQLSELLPHAITLDLQETP